MSNTTVHIVKVSEIEPLESLTHEHAVVAGTKVEVEIDDYKKGHWAVLVSESPKPYLLPLMTLNDVYPDEEMVLGISSQTQGSVLQLGPYDDALVIQEGVEVTSLFSGENQRLLRS